MSKCRLGSLKNLPWLNKQKNEKKIRLEATMKYLVQLAEFLSDRLPINGYTDETAERKKKFEATGKKAMKELASLLGMVDFDIGFNRAGMACSGDLRLMGFDRDGRGVYFLMNKDFTSAFGVLYRTIKHMKDFTGGRNHYFPFEELKTPELIRKRISELHGGEK